MLVCPLDLRLTLSTLPTVKNTSFQNPRWRMASILKNLNSHKGQIPLRSPGHRQVRSWSQTCSQLEFGIFGLSSSSLARASRSATSLGHGEDSVMEFGLDQLQTSLWPGSSYLDMSKLKPGRTPVRSQIPLRYPGHRPAVSWNLAYHALFGELAGLQLASDLSATRIA